MTLFIVIKLCFQNFMYKYRYALTIFLLATTERGAKMQMWTRIGSNRLNALLRNRRYPRRPDVAINIPALKSPVNMDDNYGLRLTTYYRVGTKLFNLIHIYSQWCRNSNLSWSECQYVKETLSWILACGLLLHLETRLLYML